MKQILVFIIFCLTGCYASTSCKHPSSNGVTANNTADSTVMPNDTDNIIGSIGSHSFSSGKIDRSELTFEWDYYSNEYSNPRGKNENDTGQYIIEYGYIEDPFTESYEVCEYYDSFKLPYDSIVYFNDKAYALMNKTYCKSTALGIVIRDKASKGCKLNDTIRFYKDMFSDTLNNYGAKEDLRNNILNFDFRNIKLDSIKSDTIFFNFCFGQNESCWLLYFTYKYWPTGDSIYYENPWTDEYW